MNPYNIVGICTFTGRYGADQNIGKSILVCVTVSVSHYIALPVSSLDHLLYDDKIVL